MKRILTIAVIAGVIGTIIFLLVKNKKTIDAAKVVVDRSEVPISVALQPVQRQEVDGDIVIPAILTAKEEANIPAAASGLIARLDIELGSRVSKGQVIGTIDLRENELKLQSAELAVQKLSRDYERNKVLVAANATNANAEIDSKYDVDTKKLEVLELKKQMANGNIVAPINGIITDKKMVTGEYANTGAAIATVVDIFTLKGEVYVPETSVFKLKREQKATLTSEILPGETFNATVTYISPKGDDNHNYLVELTVHNNNKSSLKAGVYVMVRFNTATYKALQIPKIALVNGIKDPYVYVAENNKAVERRIVVGRELGENIEVLGGLTQQEQIITSGHINVVNGSNIKPIGNK